jgi:hypothetical protein
MAATVLHPPNPLELAGLPRPVVFLAGSIEMGAAAPWQDRIIAELDGRQDLPVTLLNPRRPEWDSSWVQSISNPVFREQVEWELAGLEAADLILMHFDAATRSPITLLELGLHARGGKLVLSCPDGFWRKGNVDVVAARYRIRSVDGLDALVAAVAAWAPG